jgi:hypothetical protein
MELQFAYRQGKKWPEGSSMAICPLLTQQVTSRQTSSKPSLETVPGDVAQRPVRGPMLPPMVNGRQVSAATRREEWRNTAPVTITRRYFIVLVRRRKTTPTRVLWF